MESEKQIQAAKCGYLILSAIFCVLGIVVIAVPDFSLRLLCRLGGILLIVFGIIKIVGYFAKDLYRLAFQHDLAFGILPIALGLILLFRTNLMLNFICTLIGIYILADALLKIQTSLDAKEFGITLWWLILAAAVPTGVAGFLLIVRPHAGARAIMILIGISLLAEGILNMILTLTAVKILHRRDIPWDDE